MQVHELNFYGDRLYGVKEQDAIYIPLKPICEAMGIDHKSQHHRVNRDPVLAKGGVIMTIPFGNGGTQQMFCLSLNRLNFWLATVQPDRIKNDAARDRAMLYREECADVLAAYFLTGKLPANPHLSAKLLQDDLFGDAPTTTPLDDAMVAAIADAVMDRVTDVLVEKHIATREDVLQATDAVRCDIGAINKRVKRIDSTTASSQYELWQVVKLAQGPRLKMPGPSAPLDPNRPPPLASPRDPFIRPPNKNYRSE